MVIFIILVVGYFVVTFLLDRKEETSRVKKQGGIRVKYSQMINYLIGLPDESTVVKESPTSITIMSKGKGVVQLFTLSHGFSDFTVFWEMKNTVLGTHNLHWRFPEGADQVKAILQINDEIESYVIFLAKQHIHKHDIF